MKATNLALLFSILFALLLSGCSGGDGDDDDTRTRTGGDNATNAVPTANDDSFTTQADTALDAMLTGDDPEGETLSFAVESEPEQGVLSLEEDGSFSYQPNSSYTGVDQFTFTVSDGENTSAPATVDVVIDPMQVSFSSYSRDAFNQAATDEPLPTNGREFDQDVTDEGAYDDLLMANE